MKTGKVKIEIYADQIEWEPVNEQDVKIKHVIVGENSVDIVDLLKEDCSLEFVEEFICENYDVKGAFLSARQEKILDMNEQRRREAI